MTQRSEDYSYRVQRRQEQMRNGFVVCPKCERLLPSTLFVKSQYQCADCRTAKKRRYYQANAEKMKAEARKRHSHMRRTDPAKARRLDAISTASRDPVKARKRYREYAKMRRRTDPVYRLCITLRSRVKCALNAVNAEKCAKTMELIGCTIGELRSHLESQFTEGMTWETHALRGWHIDHIKPCHTFDLSDPAQQRECFHYTNLRPLWWQDNLARNRKYGVLETA